MVEIVNIDKFDDTSELHDSLEKVPKEYQEFQESEGIPVHRGMYFDDINLLETGKWDRSGQYGAFVNLDGANGVCDLHIQELEPDGQTDWRNHLYEEIVYVTQGQGFTVINPGNQEDEMVFEWNENSLFLIPPLTSYKHVNATNDRTKLVSQTTLPQMLKIMKNKEYIFDLDEKGYHDKDFYSSEGSLYEVDDTGFTAWSANFIPDILTFEEIEVTEQLGAQKSSLLMQEESVMGGHTAEIPSRMYKNAHRHGPGATLFFLSGEGYSLIWREGWEKRVRVDWSEGTVFSPPARWYHHHFNLTSSPERHFAIHSPQYGTLHDFGNPVFNFAHPENIRDYPDQDPEIREEFERELEKKGMESDMPEECYSDPDYELNLR